MKHLITTNFVKSFFPIFAKQFINSRVVKSMTITIFMDVKEMYTVLSRTTKLEYIHLRNNQLYKRYSERKRDNFMIKNSYFNTDFHKGKISKYLRLRLN